MVSEGGRAEARIDPDEEYAGPRPDVIGQAPRALPRSLAVIRVRMIRHAMPPHHDRDGDRRARRRGRAPENVLVPGL